MSSRFVKHHTHPCLIPWPHTRLQASSFKSQSSGFATFVRLSVASGWIHPPCSQLYQPASIIFFILSTNKLLHYRPSYIQLSHRHHRLSSIFQLTFNDALKAYEKRTKDLRAHPLCASSKTAILPAESSLSFTNRYRHLIIRWIAMFDGPTSPISL